MYEYLENITAKSSMRFFVEDNICQKQPTQADVVCMYVFIFIFSLLISVCFASGGAGACFSLIESIIVR